jgi:hypothetical protein
MSIYAHRRQHRITSPPMASPQAESALPFEEIEREAGLRRWSDSVSLRNRRLRRAVLSAAFRDLRCFRRAPIGADAVPRSPLLEELPIDSSSEQLVTAVDPGHGERSAKSKLSALVVQVPAGRLALLGQEPDAHVGPERRRRQVAHPAGGSEIGAALRHSSGCYSPIPSIRFSRKLFFFDFFGLCSRLSSWSRGGRSS